MAAGREGERGRESNYSTQRPQIELLLSLENQICQQLDAGQEALVSGQWGRRTGGGGAIIRADRVPLFI